MTRKLSTVSFSIVLLIPFLAYLAEALPLGVPTLGLDPSDTTRPLDSNTVCSFRGDDDTYGLGIRIAIYLQWITSSIAYSFVAEEAFNIRGVNTGVTLANLAGLLYITCVRGNGQPSGTLYAVECWIGIMFCLGGICPGPIYVNDNVPVTMTFVRYRAPAIGQILQYAVSMAVVFYTVWFLYVGMDMMASPSCSQYAFFFAKVDLFHGFRTFLKVVFTMGAIVCGIWAIVRCGFINPAFTSYKCRTDFPSFNDCHDEAYPKIITLAGFLVVISFITSTEMVIKWNNIQGVYSVRGTGQLLPVVLSGCNLVRVVWKLLALASPVDNSIELASPIDPDDD